MAVTATGARNNVARYRSMRSFESSGIGAPPGNPAGTYPGIVRVRVYSPTSGVSNEASRRGVPQCQWIPDNEERHREIGLKIYKTWDHPALR
jgi:hypothetical protein